MDRRVFNIKDKLSQDLGRHWSVQDMANDVGMSVPHFLRSFKDASGISPMAYLKGLRFEKAREFLADSECNLRIKEICFLVGFANNSNFTRGFKAKFGMTPTEFRNHNAEIHQSNPQNEYK